MFFRNATMFSIRQLHPDITHDFVLKSLPPLREPGPLEVETFGFLPVPAQAADGTTWVTLGSWKRHLPMAAVRAELKKLVDQIEAREGRPVGSRGRKLLTSQIIERMLPNAPMVPSRTHAFIDWSLELVVVDTASRATAERVVSELRNALGTFPAMPISQETAPRAALTSILRRYDSCLHHGDMVELRAPAAGGEVVKITNGQLDSDEVTQHLRAGLQAVRLDVTTERMGVVLGDDLVLRKLRMLDVVLDKLSEGEREDEAAEASARMALMVGEFRQLFEVVRKALSITV